MTLPAGDEMTMGQVNSELSESGGVERSGFEANRGVALTYNSYRQADTHSHRADSLTSSGKGRQLRSLSNSALENVGGWGVMTTWIEIDEV